MLDTQDLELLLAVVETGTMQAASERVHLSQPAISRRIAAVEKRVNVKLFTRTGRRLQLTEAGGEFVRRAGEILNRLQDLEVEMSAFGRGQRGVLRIGATVTVCRYLLAPVLEEMRQRYGQYELFVTNESSRRMPDLVREGAVDVGIASLVVPLSGLQVREWTRLHLGLLRKGSQSKEAVSVSLLQGAPLVMSSPGTLRSAVDTLLRTHNIQPRIVAQADSLEVVRVLVGCGFGNAIVPIEALQEEPGQEGFSLTPFVEEIEPLPVACFYGRVQPPLRAFLGLLPNST
ncbi:MAG: LysR family transcriptional regulator [Armatimonadota bacterium]|nr:LysR family transcriptional regulator [Armatimonadota bacterium]